jgi:hypothetical protein
MVYARINKLKVFNNREGSLGLFNRAMLRIYSHAAGYSAGTESCFSPLTLAGLINLDDNAHGKKPLEISWFVQSHSLEINGEKDNQTLTFRDSVGKICICGETN